MRSAIFVWASLLLIGAVSISQGYSNYHEDSDEDQLNDLEARLASVLKSSESKRGRWFNAAPNKRASACVTCSPACADDEVCTTSGVCICPGGWGNSPCPLQSERTCFERQTLGGTPLVKITFGSGTAAYSTATPASLGFTTSYPQQTKSPINDGNYGIVNAVQPDFGSWLGGGLDHTTGGCASGTTKGYMMIVNAQYTANQNILSIPANNLCIGLRYEFSFYAANINKKGSNILLPDFLVTITSTTGSKSQLASFISGPLPEQSALTWVKVGLSFIATSTSVTATINSITPGGGGNDFVLDDITFVGCSTKSTGVCK